MRSEYENFENFNEQAPALRVIRAETWLTVYRAHASLKIYSLGKNYQAPKFFPNTEKVVIFTKF